MSLRSFQQRRESYTNLSEINALIITSLACYGLYTLGKNFLTKYTSFSMNNYLPKVIADFKLPFYMPSSKLLLDILPGGRDTVRKEVAAQVQALIRPILPLTKQLPALPTEGIEPEELFEHIDSIKTRDIHNGITFSEKLQISGPEFEQKSIIIQAVSDAFSSSSFSPLEYPSLRYMENSIISSLCELLHLEQLFNKLPAPTSSIEAQKDSLLEQKEDLKKQLSEIEDQKRGETKPISAPVLAAKERSRLRGLANKEKNVGKLGKEIHANVSVVDQDFQNNGCGSITSGDMDSYVSVLKVYRDRARALWGTRNPEIVLSVASHPGWFKAAHLLDVLTCIIPLSSELGNYSVDIDLYKKAISRNTILLIANVPTGPHGLIDPVVEISHLASTFNITVHVDASQGGFFLALLERLQRDDPTAYINPITIPIWDFRIKEVTSINLNLSRDGYAPIGSGVVIYRTTGLRQYQFDSTHDSPGGLYLSPTPMGPTPGSAIAGLWATMQLYGKRGYFECIKKTIEAKLSVVKVFLQADTGINQMYKYPEFEIIGTPIGSTVSIKVKNEFLSSVNILFLADVLELDKIPFYTNNELYYPHRPWVIKRQIYPESISLTFSAGDCGNIEEEYFEEIGDDEKSDEKSDEKDKKDQSEKQKDESDDDNPDGSTPSDSTDANTTTNTKLTPKNTKNEPVAGKLNDIIILDGKKYYKKVRTFSKIDAFLLDFDKAVRFIRESTPLHGYYHPSLPKPRNMKHIEQFEENEQTVFITNNAKFANQGSRQFYSVLNKVAFVSNTLIKTFCNEFQSQILSPDTLPMYISPSRSPLSLGMNLDKIDVKMEETLQGGALSDIHRKIIKSTPSLSSFVEIFQGRKAKIPDSKKKYVRAADRVKVDQLNEKKKGGV
jgi:glutamate/tyrosine decarboxylase-like PLP-dependent enzyme